MTASRPTSKFPHRYKLAGAGYCKRLAVQRGIPHKTVGNVLYTSKPL